MKRARVGTRPRRQASVLAGSCWALAFANCCLTLASTVEAAPIYAAPPPFSLDMVASNLQRLADNVPPEGWQEHLLNDKGCSCVSKESRDGDFDPNAEEASAEVSDEDFQVAPPVPRSNQVAPYANDVPPAYRIGLLQQADSQHRAVVHQRHQSGCNCASQATAGSSTALSWGEPHPGATDEPKDAGMWLNTCQYTQPDLVFWRLTNTAYLRGGIVLKETIAYTDSCDMCSYNNVACNKAEVELTDGNCLCMWRMNGVEMVTELLACSACVSDCIGAYRTFDVGKPEPGFQKGMCLRKKAHMQLDDLDAIG